MLFRSTAAGQAGSGGSRTAAKLPAPTQTHNGRYRHGSQGPLGKRRTESCCVSRWKNNTPLSPLGRVGMVLYTLVKLALKALLEKLLVLNFNNDQCLRPWCLPNDVGL